MFSPGGRHHAILSRLDEEGMTADRWRRVVAVAVATALELTTKVVARGGHALAEDMRRLPQYVDAIDIPMQRRQPG